MKQFLILKINRLERFYNSFSGYIVSLMYKFSIYNFYLDIYNGIISRFLKLDLMNDIDYILYSFYI